MQETILFLKTTYRLPDLEISDAIRKQVHEAMFVRAELLGRGLFGIPDQEPTAFPPKQPDFSKGFFRKDMV